MPKVVEKQPASAQKPVSRLAKRGKNRPRLTPDPTVSKTAPKRWGWKPGESGNPNGRPTKERCLTDLLRQAGIEQNYSRMRSLSLAIWRLAIAGDHHAYELIFERIEGKVLQQVAVQGVDISVGLPEGMTSAEM